MTSTTDPTRVPGTDHRSTALAEPTPVGHLDASTHRALAIAFGSHAHQIQHLTAVLNDFCKADLGTSGLIWHGVDCPGDFSHGDTHGHEHRFALHDTTGHGHIADISVYHPQLISGAALTRLEDVLAIVTVTLSAHADQRPAPAPATAPRHALIAIRIDNFDRLLAEGGIEAGRRAADRICEVVDMITGQRSDAAHMQVAADGLLELHVTGNTAGALDTAERIRTVMAAQPLSPGQPPLTVSVLVAMGVHNPSRSALRATRNAVVCS